MALRSDPDRLAELEEERAFLLRSLDDLDRERAAGDIDEHDFATLHDDYTARAAAVLKAIEAEQELVAPKRPRNVKRIVLWSAVVVVVESSDGGAVVVVVPPLSWADAGAEATLASRAELSARHAAATPSFLRWCTGLCSLWRGEVRGRPAVRWAGPRPANPSGGKVGRFPLPSWKCNIRHL